MIITSDRRILTFPAIHPCTDVAPSTIVSSLIVLARNISGYRSRRFVTHKRNVREAIRLVGVVLIFLEEIKDQQLPDSIVLCFIELHIAFQKLSYLLDDLCRDGARLWVLTKSKSVSAGFQVVAKAVATALDVLPLCLIDMSSEVKELVELVAKQAHNGKFLVDGGDEVVAFNVGLVLRGFEERVVPESRVLKRVLEHLEIGSWHDCYNEMKFLDDEIDLASSNGDEKEFGHLSSLMGFMSYCRGVVFEFIDGNISRDHRVDFWPDFRLNCLNSEDFRCPISLEIMTDPVTVASGHTYDRVSIQKWFKTGNNICPNTGEKLKTTVLVSNLALQNLIRMFCFYNRVHFPETGTRNKDLTRTVYPGSLASGEAMTMLSLFLANRLAFGSSEAKNKAAYEIRLFAKSNIFNRSCMAETGTIIPTLLNLLCSMDTSIQENSIAALLNLSKLSTSKTMIVENGGLLSILDVLSKGLTMESRQLAAATLFYLSSVEDYRILIGEIHDAIPALAEMIKDGSPRGGKNAVVAIFSLLLYPGNHERVLVAGTVPLLVDVLRAPERADLVTDSLAVLATLAENIEGTIAILCASALPQIVGILQTSSSRTAKEYCVSILLSLSTNGGDEVVTIFQKTPSLMASLYSLLTDGTSRASKKASSVLSILHQFHNANLERSLTPTVSQERFVHVRYWRRKEVADVGDVRQNFTKSGANTPLFKMLEKGKRKEHRAVYVKNSEKPVKNYDLDEDLDGLLPELMKVEANRWFWYGIFAEEVLETAHRCAVLRYITVDEIRQEDIHVAGGVLIPVVNLTM
ncbi:hypothetical protein GIB67_016538 [Kingdonia uniflora]|uniref:RING-type E3 ubiquitin transferase n=1 Tax=Kingdonia uniflora TaxID=39325 RepID=A0A7J7NR20_9MAGN|nr:hypothetical protein GIB67_016538 [Kingdonia uniflora]